MMASGLQSAGAGDSNMLSRKNCFKGVLALILVPALWYGCGSSNNNNGPSGPAVTPAVPTPTATVLIPAGAAALGTGAYSPNPLNIAPGTNVVWVNNDTTPHSATSGPRNLGHGPHPTGSNIYSRSISFGRNL